MGGGGEALADAGRRRSDALPLRAEALREQRMALEVAGDQRHRWAVAAGHGRDRPAVEADADGVDVGAAGQLDANDVPAPPGGEDADRRLLAQRRVRHGMVELGRLDRAERVDVARLARRRWADGVLEQQRAQLLRREPRRDRGHQRRDAGDVRRRHRRARAGLVTAVVGGRDDALARCGDRHAQRAEVRELRNRLPVVGGRRGGDADEVVRRDRDRVQRAAIDVRAGVAGGADDQDVGCRRVLDRGPDLGVVGFGLEAEVDDPRAVGRGVADAVGEHLRRSGPARVEDPDHHQLGLVGDPDDALAVLRRRDRSRDVGAVPLAVVERVLARKVHAMDVVDVAVAVVVFVVPRDLGRVAPQVRRKVRVAEPDAGVDHRDDHAGALGELPRARQVEHGLGRRRPLLVGLGIGNGTRRRGDQQQRREHDEGAGHHANLDRVGLVTPNRGRDDHAPAPRDPVRACSHTDIR